MAPLIPITQISNSPIAGLSTLTRKLDLFSIYINKSIPQVTFGFYIRYYDSNGDEVTQVFTQQPTTSLTADNLTPVNPDGSFSFNKDGTPNWATGTVGEYDFIVAALQNSAFPLTFLNTMIQTGITAKDSKGGFNN